jgi:hypothetical protein
LSPAIFDPAVLSFAMIMLCYVGLVKIHNLDDIDLKSILTNVYYILIAFLFIPFILSIYLGIQNDNNYSQLLDLIHSSDISLKTESIIPYLENLTNLNNEYLHHLDVVRILATILSFFAIVVSFICKWKWKIGSGIYGE